VTFLFSPDRKKSGRKAVTPSNFLNLKSKAQELISDKNED